MKVEFDNVSEDNYPKDLEKEAYNDFWEDLSQHKKDGMGKRRGS